MCAFHDIMLQRQFAFTVLDHPDGCSSDDVAKLKATVSKFRLQSEIISAARQKISRDLSLTGKYTTKHRDRHVITREPGGAIRGSRVQRKQAHPDDKADAAKYYSSEYYCSEPPEGDITSISLESRDDVALVRKSAEGLPDEVTIQETASELDDNDAAGVASSHASARHKPANACTPGPSQLVYRWDLTNAMNALVAKSDAFTRIVKPHIVAAAKGAFSLKEIARRLDEQGIKTVTGKFWSSVALSLVIRRGAIMGLTEYRQLFDRFISQPGQSNRMIVRQRKKKITPH
jgi:hypothetical protein